MTRVALLGFGTVGKAVAQGLDRVGARLVAVADRGGAVHAKEGLDIQYLLAAKRRSGSVRSYPGQGVARFAGARDLLDGHGDAIDVVIEATPTDLRTGQPALGHIEAALRAGADVVAANKGPFALHGGRVRDLARETGRRVRCSATVCGGVPVLELNEAALRGDRLLRIEGVLNGSTSFVLSALEQGLEFEDALRRARALGILEADPSLDLLGLDARAKACILGNALLGQAWTLDDVPGEGITGVTRRDAEEARARGFALRLVAKASPEGAEVRLVELPRDGPLCTAGTENAVRLTFDLAGPVVLRGAGAGAGPTASAVLSDVAALRRSAPTPAGPRAAAHRARAAPSLVA